MKLLTRIFIVLPFLIILALIGTAVVVGINLHQLERKTWHYLTDERDYKDEDIEQIKARLGKLPLYQAHVTFQDEPQNIYVYRRIQDRIIQIEPSSHYSPEQYKHAE